MMSNSENLKNPLEIYQKRFVRIGNVNQRKKGFIDMKRMIRVAIFILWISLMVGFIETGFIVNAARNEPTKEATVVVLGCRVFGTKPSAMLQARLDAAYTYLAAHPEAPVIVCGGQGDDEEISEAQCMYEYLVEKGIAPERIYMEEQSTSTRENITYAKAIIEKEGLSEHIAIATNDYHELRASLVADSVGLTSSAISAKTQLHLLPKHYARELVGVLLEVVF